MKLQNNQLLIYFCQCLNKDGVEIELNVGYQYRARQNELHRIVSEFKDHDGYEEVLKSAGEER